MSHDDPPRKDNPATPKPGDFPDELTILPFEPGPGDDPEEFDDFEDEPRTVLITGASGNIGRKLRAAWDDCYDLILIDQYAQGDPGILEADLADWDDEWTSYFEGVDTVIHLAANPSEKSRWDELVGPNIDAISNVFLAAAMAGVERIVYASSNHTMSGYRLDGSTGPLTVDTPPKPGNPYGGAKLMGERLGRTLSSALGITFIALRIGWVLPGDNRPSNLPDDPWEHGLWLSNDDLVRLFDCTVEADLAEGQFIVVNGMSNNKNTRWSLQEAADLLGYDPVDDSSDR